MWIEETRFVLRSKQPKKYLSHTWPTVQFSTFLPIISDSLETPPLPFPDIFHFNFFPTMISRAFTYRRYTFPFSNPILISRASLYNVYLSLDAVIRDARCFLENGATAAHLFVGEDLQVGDTVGVLGVLGDPGPQGDIELRLQELDSPVTFSAYSKNLTLIRPLDKEGVDGPASVYVNVICERKHTLDPVLYAAYYERRVTNGATSFPIRFSICFRDS